MARHVRKELPGAIHHAVAQAASDSRIVIDDADRLRFHDELRRVVAECDWECIAFSLMSTHVHLVLCTREPNLGRGMGLLLGRYAFTHNHRHGRRGHLFSDRYWSRRIDRPHYLACAATYAVLNPVNAGLCAHPAEDRWSSYRETAGLIPPSGLLDPSLLFRAFSVDQDAARRHYVELIESAVERLRRRREDELWWQTVARSVTDLRLQADARVPRRQPGRPAEARRQAPRDVRLQADVRVPRRQPHPPC
jgi:REP element-mobilizing transposase RayT